MHHRTFSLALTIALAAFASAQAEEVRIKHYMANQPTNVQEAVANLHAESNKIAVLLAKHQTLTPAQLEAIHEISYQLEADQKTLAKNESTQQIATALHDPIEEIHEESEEHDARGTRRAFDALKQAMATHMHDKVAAAK
jgi:hypothetical protein